MTAAKMMKAVEEAIAGLASQKRSPITDERLASIGYRKLVLKNYIVFFTIDKKNKR